jgi:DNA repair protein RadD
MASFELRNYQRAAVDALLGYWGLNGGNGLIVLPTGSGKSLVIAALCQELLRDFPRMRIGIITHVRELIAQNHRELLALWPEAPAGIYSAGMGRRDVNERILFMGIQSVWKRSLTVGNFDLLLIDEAHLVSHNDDTMYRKFFEEQRARTPDLRIAGLTATAFRLDTGQLNKGDGRIFDDVVFEANVRDLIEEGYLCKLVTKATQQKLDVSNVHTRAGEYITSELEEAIDKADITRAACLEIAGAGFGRRSWLVFCITVSHGVHVCEELQQIGVNAKSVFGTTPKGERDLIIEEFRRGEIQALVSVNVLGTGFNVCEVDLIAGLRPTQSAGLWLQQVGRGLRNAPGKVDCLVMDFSGNTRRHGPIDTIKSDLINHVDVVECPSCHSIVPADSVACPDCGHLFPIEVEPPITIGEDSGPMTMHDAKADEDAVIISDARSANLPQWVPVDSVHARVHYKNGNPDATPTMRVDYMSGRFNIYSEWICPEHPPGSYPYRKALSWIGQNMKVGAATSATRVDDLVLLANEGFLIKPSHILVRPDGRFFKILDRKFGKITA